MLWSLYPLVLLDSSSNVPIICSRLIRQLVIHTYHPHLVHNTPWTDTMKYLLEMVYEEDDANYYIDIRVYYILLPLSKRDSYRGEE